MTLDELVTLVADRTKRIDKLTEIRTSARKAIRTVHSAGYFPRDIVEDEVDLGGVHSEFKIMLPPRIRKFVGIAPLSSNGKPIRLTTADNFYEQITPKEVINNSFTKKSDTYYVAGATLIVRGTVGAAKLYVSYYAYPEVQDNSLETWLMLENDSIFIDATLADFYKIIGRQQMARDHRSDMLLGIQSIINDFTDMEE